ncbi:MAG: Veg family protein [Bacillota bacterium]
MAARKVEPMVADSTLRSIRCGLEGHLGRPLTVKADKGRRRVSVNEGVLENTYPNIFVVKVNASGGPRRLTYTYSELLTRAVRIRFNDGSGEFSVGRLAKSA